MCELSNINKMAYFYTACVTIFSTGGKVHPISNFTYTFFSNRPFLCAFDRTQYDATTMTSLQVLTQYLPRYSTHG